MRNWRGNRRYLVLVVALTGGVLATILAAVAALGPRWAVPHMLPLGVLVAIEALLTQRLVRQARQTWTEQWPRRLLEWAVLLLVIRGWSLAASPRPFWATITPWLRDPVAAFDMRFLAYCMLSFMCWAIATALGGEVWRWTAERAADVVARDTIERGHLDEERAEVMRRFDQRLATLVGVAVVCALWALRGESGGLALLGRGAGLAVGGVWVTIGCAFALHSAAKLNQLYDGWCSDNVVIETGVMRRWSRGSGLLVGLLIVLGPLLGLVTLVTPPPPLAPLFAALVFLVGVMYAIALFAIGIVLFPFALLLSLFRSERGASAPLAPPRFTPPPVDAARFGERPLLPALIFWGCVLLLVGLLVIRYARQHAGLWHWLRRWRWGRWVLRIASRLWRDVGGWATLVATRTRRRLERRPRRPPGTNQPGGPDAQMRALYAQLIREGQARGIVHHPADTPFEYGNALGDAVPPAQSEVNALTSAYVQAAYGPAAPTDADVSAGKRLWRRVRQALGRAVS